jgi:hypothetical protein
VSAGLNEGSISEFVGHDFRSGLVEIDDSVAREAGFGTLPELPDQVRSPVGGQDFDEFWAEP